MPALDHDGLCAVSGSRPVAGLRVRVRRAALLLALSLGVASGPSAVAAESARVLRHPGSESALDARGIYPEDVLRLALDHAGLAYRLRPVATAMPQARSLRLLEAGGLDVLWTTPEPDRLARLRMVPVPVDGGMIGWRLLLIRRADAARFAAIDTLPALSTLRFAQGHDWPDVAILRGNGLHVSANPSYEGLFGMLGRGHVDAVPRGLAEGDAEVRDHVDDALMLEPHLALHARNGLFFFVRRDDTALAEALERGLRLSLADGSLQRLFETHYGAAIADARLRQRRILELRNPLLPDALATTLWFDPGRAR